MASQGSIAHYFPGANTPQGFFSLYDHIAPAAANRIFVIKGGPGVGKSTFMKKIAADLVAQGFDVEFHHCSADNNSIDAIYIPAGDVAMLDGTSPHVVDPKHPGAVDTILHLGDFWDEAAMRTAANREGIFRTTAGCGFRFKRANDALKAAKACLEEWRAYYADCLDQAALLRTSEDLIADVLPDRQEKAARVRRLFASAVTYDGPKEWLDSLFAGASHRWVIQGPPGTGKARLLGRLADAAVARGYDAHLFHCPMYPDQIDHIRLPELDAAVITSEWPHVWTIRDGDTVIDTAAFVDHARLAAYEPDIHAVKAAFETSIQREMHHLGMAKQIHDELEQFYIPHMDFTGIERLRLQTLSRILELIGEREGAQATIRSS